MAGDFVLVTCTSGRSAVSPSAKPWSGSQTLPSESVIEVDNPALMRTGGAGVEAAGAAGAAGAATTAGAAGAAGAAAATGAAGAAASAGAAGAAGAVVVSADVLSLLTLPDWQPVNKITATSEIKHHDTKRFTFCINYFLCSVTPILSFHKNAAMAGKCKAKNHGFSHALPAGHASPLSGMIQSEELLPAGHRHRGGNHVAVGNRCLRHIRPGRRRRQIGCGQKLIA